MDLIWFAYELDVEGEDIWRIEENFEIYFGQCLIDNGVIPCIGKTGSSRLEKRWKLGALFWRYLWDTQVEISGRKSSVRPESRGKVSLYLTNPCFWTVLVFLDFFPLLRYHCYKTASYIRLNMCSVYYFLRIYFYTCGLCVTVVFSRTALVVIAHYPRSIIYLRTGLRDSREMGQGTALGRYWVEKISELAIFRLVFLNSASQFYIYSFLRLILLLFWERKCKKRGHHTSRVSITLEPDFSELQEWVT